MPTKPLVYGYLRAHTDTPDDELTHAVERMQRFADAEGLCYVTTYFEWQPGSRAVFYELVEELKRAEARHVVVPSVDHLSSHRLLRGHMIDRLDRDASALVLIPDGA